MTTQDDLPRSSFDIVDETSAQSFPASDAPGWAIGRDYLMAQGARATEDDTPTSTSTQSAREVSDREESERGHGRPHDDRASRFR